AASPGSVAAGSGNAGLGMRHAPYLPRRLAWAIARSIRCRAGNWPSPPRRHAPSLNSFAASVRHVSAKRSVGTGCHEWLLSLLGVESTPVPMHPYVRLLTTPGTSSPALATPSSIHL